VFQISLSPTVIWGMFRVQLNSIQARKILRQTEIQWENEFVARSANLFAFECGRSDIFAAGRSKWTITDAVVHGDEIECET
jgi:hypothetical protein